MTSHQLMEHLGGTLLILFMMFWCIKLSFMVGSVLVYFGPLTVPAWVMICITTNQLLTRDTSLLYHEPFGGMPWPFWIAVIFPFIPVLGYTKIACSLATITSGILLIDWYWRYF